MPRPLSTKPGGLQILNTRQVFQAFQIEMVKEGGGRVPFDRAAGAAPATTWADPSGLEQDVDGPLPDRDASNVLDLGAGHRLMVGDDRQGFGGGSGQAARRFGNPLQSVAKVGGGTKRP